MQKQWNSVRNKILFSDFLIITPVILLFFVLMLIVLRDSNHSVYNSRLEVLQERCGNIERSNDEIIRIINALSVNSDVNRLMSQKNKAEGYEYITNNRTVQDKMQELTELFYNRQYQMMLLGENGNNYFQRSLQLGNSALNLEELKEEEWYQEMQETNSVSVYFLARYRSPLLAELFPKDTLFAVQEIKNLNSGREIGLLILAANQLTWAQDSESDTNDEDNSIIVDQHGKFVFPLGFFFEKFEIDDVSGIHSWNVLVESETGYVNTSIGNKEYMLYFTEIGGMDWKLLSFEEKRTSWSIYAMLTSVLGLASMAGIAFMAILNCNFISLRMKRINANILEVSGGNLQARIQENYEVEFQEICSNFNIMLDQIEDLMTQLKIKEQEKYTLEFFNLQSQINSHFLHNTLATVRFMIQIGEYDNADQTLISFSKLLRKTFADSRRIISLQEELEMVEDYMKLMSLRYQGRFSWKISADVDTGRLAILKNTLQPLVENSISHGFNMKEEMGHIFIRVKKEQAYILIEVEDDGVGADLKKINTCIHEKDLLKNREQFSEIGISNIQMRIIRNFGNEYGLSAEMNNLGGVTFRMKLPWVDFMEGVRDA